MHDTRLAIETMNVLHRLILTKDSLATQRACVEVVGKILDAASRSANTMDETANSTEKNNNNAGSLNIHIRTIYMVFELTWED